MTALAQKLADLRDDLKFAVGAEEEAILKRIAELEAQAPLDSQSASEPGPASPATPIPASDSETELSRLNATAERVFPESEREAIERVATPREFVIAEEIKRLEAAGPEIQAKADRAAAEVLEEADALLAPIHAERRKVDRVYVEIAYRSKKERVS